jgi:hypothetical protein
MQGGENRTVIGRICFHCELPVGEEALFCDHCGGDLDLKKWMASNLAPQAEEAQLPAKERWSQAKERLSQIPTEQLLVSRPALPTAGLEFVAFNEASTHALLLGVDGAFLVLLSQMQGQLLLSDNSSGRCGAFSSDGSRLLIADLPNTILYFFDLSPDAALQVRAFQYPALAALHGEPSLAVAHQAAVTAADGSLLLFDWESGALIETIPLPTDDATPQLEFTYDGSLICGLRAQTFLFDSQGGSQEIMGVKVAISPDGSRMAALSVQPSGQLALLVGSIQSLTPFTWDPCLYPRKAEGEITHISFSADGSLLLLRVTVPGQGDSLEIINADTGALQLAVQEPLYPGVNFARVQKASATSDRLFLFADAFAAYDSLAQGSSLLCFAIAPTLRYLGSISMVVRAAGSPFAAPDGEVELCLPVGETPTGYFGRLDTATSIGANWSSTFEYPDLVPRVLLGDAEQELLTGTLLLARDDYEARLLFWFGFGVMRGLHSLVDASVGLTHLLPNIVALAGGESSSNDDFLLACHTVAAYSVADQSRLFRGEAVSASALVSSADDTLPPQTLSGDDTLPPMGSHVPQVKASSTDETLPTPEDNTPRLKPAPRPAPRPPSGLASKHAANPTMMGNASDYAVELAAAMAIPEPSTPVLRPAPKPPGRAATPSAAPSDASAQPAPKPAMKPAPRPIASPAPRQANPTMVANAADLAGLLDEPPPSPIGAKPFAAVPQATKSTPSGQIPIPNNANLVAPKPFSSAPAKAPDPKEEARAAFKISLEALGLTEEVAPSLLALPLCEVVWADGESQAKESDIVAEYVGKILSLKGVAAVAQANAWLKECPKPEYCDKARQLLRDMVKADYDASMNREQLKEIMRLANEIAGAVGGFLGMGKVSKEEKVILTKLEAAFKID